MQQEAGKALLLLAAIPKHNTGPAAGRPAQGAAARRAPAKRAAQEGIPALLTKAERRLLLNKALPTKSPSKGNHTSKSSS